MRRLGRTVLWIGAIAVLAAVAILSRRLLVERTRPAQPAVARAIQVREGSVACILRLTGTTAGEHSVTLRAPYMRGSRTRGGGAGDFHLVLKELIAQGSCVAEGHILAVFDRQAMLDRLDNLKADRDQAAASLKSLQASLLANREARKQSIRVAKAAVDTAALDLRTASVRSAIQADMFRLNLEEASANYRELQGEAGDFAASQQAQTRIAQLALDEAALEVRRAEGNAERMVVRAPRAGIVVVRDTFRNSQFDTIRAGDELRPGQPYIEIVAPGPMIVEARANQADVSRLRVGDAAEIVPEAFPEIRLPARIYAIGSVAVSNGWRDQFVRAVPILLRIARSHPQLIPSLTVSVDVVLRKVENTPVVPLEALRPGAPGEKPFALVRAGNRWEKRRLQVSLTNNVSAAVTGLEPGETVADEALEDSGN